MRTLHQWNRNDLALNAHWTKEHEVETLHAELEEQVQELNTLLTAALRTSAVLDFANLKRTVDTSPFQPVDGGQADYSGGSQLERERDYS